MIPWALARYSAKVRTPYVACTLVSRTFCGPALELSLDWTTLRPATADYIIVVQLVDADPGSTRLRLNYNYWPGRGNLRTSTWPSNRVIRGSLHAATPTLRRRDPGLGP